MIRVDFGTLTYQIIALIVWSPNEDFGRTSKHSGTYFQQPWATHPNFWQTGLFMIFPIIYAPQTTILDGWTKRCEWDFEVLFKGASTRFGPPLIENSFKNAYATLCSVFQNRRLGSIIISTTNRGSQFWENREKVGLSKMGMSCPRLIFKALFTYVSTRFGLRSFEKCFENAFPNVCSDFQNLRLGTTIFPKMWTTIRGWNNWENREKAGLSKMGMSCPRLV